MSSWPNKEIIPEFAWSVWGMRRKLSLRVASVPEEIWIEHLPNFKSRALPLHHLAQCVLLLLCRFNYIMVRVGIIYREMWNTVCRNRDDSGKMKWGKGVQFTISSHSEGGRECGQWHLYSDSQYLDVFEIKRIWAIYESIRRETYLSQSSW
jgi:hypothetical protein